MEDKLSVMEEKGKEVTKEQKELLYNRVEELKCSNAALQAENDMFEQFISRISQVGRDGLGVAEASQLEGVGHGRRQRSQSNISDRLHQLTLEQKLYVAQREVTETRKEQEKLRQRYERIQDNYKASMKEAELRLEEIRKAKNGFERRLLKPMKDNRLEMKEAEKVLQYMEDKSKRQQVAQLEKLKLENQALKIYEKKLQQKLRQKKETGKAEYEEMEYSEQTVKKKEKKELQVNNLQRVLRSHKEKLQSVTQESTELSNDISNRKQMLAKIEKELQHAEEERLKAEALNQHLRRQMTDYQAPSVTEYMQVKEKHKKLQQSIHTWERKVGIAQMALKTHAKAQRAALTPANSALAGARSEGHQIPVKLPYIQEHST